MLLFARISLWHMVPIAVGLHGLMFIIPVPSPDPIVEKQEQKPVSIASLPKPSPQKTTLPTPKAQPSSKPSVKPVAIAKPSPTTTLAQPIVVSTPLPSTIATPSPSVTPSPSPSLSPSPSPKDVLQLDEATPGCNGREGCWQVLETKGRMVAGTLEKQLQDQGYQVIEKELNEDTGMRVYQVEKTGTQPYYLHFIWSDRGTAYVRNAQILSRSELEEMTKL